MRLIHYLVPLLAATKGVTSTLSSSTEHDPAALESRSLISRQSGDPIFPINLPNPVVLYTAIGHAIYDLIIGVLIGGEPGPPDPPEGVIFDTGADALADRIQFHADRGGQTLRLGSFVDTFRGGRRITIQLYFDLIPGITYDHLRNVAGGDDPIRRFLNDSVNNALNTGMQDAIYAMAAMVNGGNGQAAQVATLAVEIRYPPAPDEL